METLVGRRALYNPVFNGGIFYSNGTELTPPVKNIQAPQNTIIGTIIEDRNKEVFITGGPASEGWVTVYLMEKQFLTLLRTEQQNISDNQIGS